VINSDDDPPTRVATTVDGPIACLTLNRPEARNALDYQFGRELDAALTNVEQDESVRVILLAAKGPAFCAGADLKALAAGEAEAFVSDRGWGGLTSRRHVKPIVAVIEGPALAGGCELALACDLVVASSLATFGLPEIRHGLLAAAGGAARLPRIVGGKLALEMLLTGDPIDAARAYEIGLVNRLVGPGGAIAEARRLASRIAGHAPAAVDAVLRVAETSLAVGEADADALARNLLHGLLVDDYAQGRLAAFGEQVLNQ
jgi:enoyl-CoA hydratase